jgi:two-component system cell cycle sensor histidine kinase/response regulator CckA
MSPFGSGCALLAEDDDDMRRLLTSVLERGGYTVVTATNGREAWERLSEQAPDLLVMDVRMPERSGLDVLMALRREGSFVPVVLISGFADGLDDLSEDYGAVVLGKPFAVVALWVAIERAPEAAAEALLGFSEPIRSTG